MSRGIDLYAFFLFFRFVVMNRMLNDFFPLHFFLLIFPKVVAYTRSKLHFAMLSLFLELRARLPNVIIGAITRESMRRALATGIKGRQVLDFLKWHAHPVVRRRTPVVPENIADQVFCVCVRSVVLSCLVSSCALCFVSCALCRVSCVVCLVSCVRACVSVPVCLRVLSLV